MLSIIVSSYQPALFTALEKNIAETCGIPYELIKIDNPNLMGIFEAYNKGASAAIYDNLLFLHEDVEFRTKNWGIVLIESLKQKNAGIIGVLGSDYVPNVPFAWWDLYENNFSHYTQYEHGKLIGDYNLLEDKKVTVIDGVFMATTITVFEKFKFNEHLSGYHAYDIEFSINVAHYYQNMVTSKIKIAHFSYAVQTLDKDWMDKMIFCRQFYTVPNTQLVIKKKELYSFLKFFAYLKEFDFPKKNIIFLLLKYSKFSKIGLRGLITSYKIILKEILS
ncbi:glycosyltransferase [Chryseobacterium gotjawalense]|uniref:Glycosyltransferase n=1 Tax=Chryseobacterium gotjawalense TaxID=3042315 RepID=A0ABY8RBG5_9FLAO|nr:glycosyltransferase [Chryseobacterium sp. wdc7]WHF50508.1 glycosyltransferase [Chryseobacterium sp. wdc7]